jgi:hypothetical protein
MQCILPISARYFCSYQHDYSTKHDNTSHLGTGFNLRVGEVRSRRNGNSTEPYYWTVFQAAECLENWVNMTYGLGLGLILHTSRTLLTGTVLRNDAVSFATIHSVGGGWHDYGALVWWYGLVNRNIRGEKNLSQCHSAHHKSYIDRSGIEPGNKRRTKAILKYQDR